MQQLGNVSIEVERYNSGVNAQIKQAFDARKQRILAKSNVLASLGVLIKKAGNVSPTFSISTPQKSKKVTVSCPVVSESSYKPEPSLDKSVYTDILLRYEGKNVFIAECKFWRGQKNFLDTISQLLGYLRWRDSKAAVIMFVPNKDFTPALEMVKQVISEHSNYIEFVDENDETWLNYSFHLDGDRNRQVSIAVMLYHTPR